MKEHAGNDLARNRSEMRVLLDAMDRSLREGRDWLQSCIVPRGSELARKRASGSLDARSS